jgi:hypothetical protein
VHHSPSSPLLSQEGFSPSAKLDIDFTRSATPDQQDHLSREHQIRLIGPGFPCTLTWDEHRLLDAIPKIVVNNAAGVQYHHIYQTLPFPELRFAADKSNYVLELKLLHQLNKCLLWLFITHGSNLRIIQPTHGCTSLCRIEIPALVKTIIYDPVHLCSSLIEAIFEVISEKLADLPTALLFSLALMPSTTKRSHIFRHKKFFSHSMPSVNTLRQRNDSSMRSIDTLCVRCEIVLRL